MLVILASLNGNYTKCFVGWIRISGYCWNGRCIICIYFWMEDMWQPVEHTVLSALSNAVKLDQLAWKGSNKDWCSDLLFIWPRMASAEQQSGEEINLNAGENELWYFSLLPWVSVYEIRNPAQHWGRTQRKKLLFIHTHTHSHSLTSLQFCFYIFPAPSSCIYNIRPLPCGLAHQLNSKKFTVLNFLGSLFGFAKYVIVVVCFAL